MKARRGALVDEECGSPVKSSTDALSTLSTLGFLLLACCNGKLTAPFKYFLHTCLSLVPSLRQSFSSLAVLLLSTPSKEAYKSGCEIKNSIYFTFLASFPPSATLYFVMRLLHFQGLHFFIRQKIGF